MLNKMPKDSQEETESAPSFRVKSYTIRAVLLVVSICFVASVASRFIDSFIDSSSDADIIQDECVEKFSLAKRAINLGDKQFVAELAITETEQVQGLSGRACLANGRGMLFVYEFTSNRCFWMKDMNFSIDILWLDSSRVVSAIEKDISPSTYPGNFCHDGQYVLELNAGSADRHGLSLGGAFDW